MSDSGLAGMPERGGFGDRFNEIERRLQSLESANRLTSASVGSGGIKVKDDGNIQFVADDGTVILEIDKAAFTYNRPDGTRIVETTPTGLRVYAANGTTLRTTLDGDGVVVGPTNLTATGLQVGTDVVIDSTGLKIDGVLQPAFWPFAARDFVSDTSLTTTATDKLTLTISPPSWVQTLVVGATVRLQMSNTSAGGQNLQVGVTTDDGGALEGRTSGTAGTHPTNSPATNATSVTRNEALALSPAGRSVNVVADASVNTGTNSSNRLRLDVIGYGIRT